MCGIAGFLGQFPAALLEAMNDAQAHRGPDDAGVFHDAATGVGLAHRRLSIIDVSVKGHQPMWDPTGRAVAVFNGEIYNYRELRSQLCRSGFRFESASDTEVLINLYLRDGIDFVRSLNGIFAFALWDSETERLLLARDLFGVKPLCYAHTPSGLVFASEMKALLKAPDVDRALDPEAVAQYLSYLYAPEPATMLRAVRKLPRGEVAVFSRAGLERSHNIAPRYLASPIADVDDRTAIAEVTRLLSQAVERQMVADVPVGAFLSGGLDSSSIVALAPRVGSAPLQCFTIGFRSGDSRMDGLVEDLPYAEQAARHLGVRLHTIWVGPEMVDDVTEMVYSLDEPQPDPAALNVKYIARLARDHGIKVLLSGGGGDDVFSGYRRHQILRWEPMWSWMPRPLRRALRGATRHLPQNVALTRRATKTFRDVDQSANRRIAGYFRWLGEEDVRSLFSARVSETLRDWDPDAAMMRRLESLPEGTPTLNKMLDLDSAYFLTDHNLNYTDKMAMSVGVEVRVPYLDPDLVDYVARLPVSMKLRGSTTKWVLREAMRPYLPASIIDRPKTGFGVPLRSWLHGPLAPVLDATLGRDAVTARGLFDAGAVQRLRDRDRLGRVDAAYTLFGLACIELWCRRFVDR